MLSIAVCIPTYKRLDLLTEAFNSCLAQTHLPQEILIGDNSPDDATQELVQQFAKSSPVPIRYFHNVPGLTQAGNVDDLFSKTRADLLLLLHDDDTLLPDCLADMHACFAQHPEIDVVVGKQYMMSNEGVIDHPLSERENRTFYRTPAYAGTKLSPLEAVMVQQFPNDCYLIRTAVAQKLRYTGKTNHACDFEFSLKVGLDNHQIYYLDKYVANYRLSADALTRNRDNNGALIIYELVEALDVPRQSLRYQAEVLRYKAPVAIAQAANLHQPGKAFRIYFSKWHRGSIASLTGLKGIYHVLRSFV